MLPNKLSKLVPSSHLMAEEEWRGLGVQQSQGWIHYMVHKPGEEPQRTSHVCVGCADVLYKAGLYDLKLVSQYFECWIILIYIIT